MQKGLRWKGDDAADRTGISLFMQEKPILHFHTDFTELVLNPTWFVVLLPLNSLESNRNFTFLSDLSILGLFTYFVR